MVAGHLGLVLSVHYLVRRPGAFFTGIGRRREDGWKVKEVPQRRVAEDGVSELNSAVVSDDCFEAGLMVYNEESLWELEMYKTLELANAYSVVLVQSFKSEAW